MNTPLIDLTSPLYLRRLARELNALPDGFYWGPWRFTRARFSKGALGLRRITETGNAQWLILPAVNDAAQAFSDAYGRSVTASRTP